MRNIFVLKMMAVAMGASLVFAGCGKQTDSAGAGNAENSIGNAENVADNSDAADTMVEEQPLRIIDDKYRTTYEIFVYSFYDSNGDGIGDLNGVTQKLDYINDGDDTTDSDLGCNEIWLMPVTPSTTYHKYDVVDYMDIDPEYGTIEDFDNLVNACHDRGVRVIVDTVFNHSSVQHPWFTQAAGFLAEHPGLVIPQATEKETSTAENSTIIAEDSENVVADAQQGWDAAIAECPYLDYYRFSTKKQDGYEPLPDTDYYYEARFWSGMPDLNLDSSALRKELSDITQFWTDHGVDGFRLDATTYFYTGDDSANIEFLSWLNDTVKSQNSDAYIVGEAWTNSATYAKYYQSGVDSFFNFDFSGSEGIIAGVARGTTPASRYAEALENNEKLLKENSESAIDAPFYTNHDMARAAGYFTGKKARDSLKLSAALNLLMPGNAFIYYGEELGMKGSGKDENKRAPMYWSAAASEGMCKGPKDMDHFDMKYPALDEQETDPYSIYSYYKKAIRMRNLYPVIARGETTALGELSDKSICAFIRSADHEVDEMSFGPDSLLVLINTSDEPQSVDLSGEKTSQYNHIIYQLNTQEESSTLEGTDLTVAPFGIALLSVD